VNTISDHPLPVPVVWVSKEVLRKYFNEHVLEKVQRGELQCELRTEKHLKVPPTGEPYCTKSQYLIYKTIDGDYVAGIHQYLRPSGELGASGKPDPNRLVVNNTMYAYSPRKTV
jgi:hypothetical protein